MVITMVQKEKRRLYFDRSNSQPTAPVATSSTLYVYETQDINANPLSKAGNLVSLPFHEGSASEMLYRLAQQYPSSRYFVYSLDSDEFQGWIEITEKNVKSIGENLRARNQLKVVKPSTLTLALHETDLLEKLVSSIVGRLKKDLAISDLSSVGGKQTHEVMEDADYDEPDIAIRQHSGPERLCITDQSLANKNWAKVREQARGVLHLRYPEL